jgi:hypothetical protein
MSPRTPTAAVIGAGGVDLVEIAIADWQAVVMSETFDAATTSRDRAVGGGVPLVRSTRHDHEVSHQHDLPAIDRTIAAVRPARQVVV